jgi:hypothetical protein
MDELKVLLLNSDFSPISVTTMRRSFSLVYKGRAEIIEEYENPIVLGDSIFMRPKVVRLLDYRHIPFRTIFLSRVNIFRRDDHKCLYCDSKKNLTLDHVIPKSRGGDNGWENLATCCVNCNKNKNDKTPEEVGFKLRHKPFKPSQNYFLTKMVSGFEESWLKYFKF